MLGLDIGCGSGSMLSAMSAAGLQAVGVDPDATARLEAQRNGYTVFAGTAEELPVEITGRKFDLVTMTHTLEHCLDPSLALTNARNVLSSRGIFYCEVPNAGSRYFESYGQISEMLDVPRHLYFFNKSALSAAARSAGLEITDWTFSGYTRHFLPGWKAWENSIFERLRRLNVKLVCSRRTLVGDLVLLSRSAFLPPERRYDCIGFIARRAADV
jgi:2-polyprenyl-3-methyl-5-hydroxy-6-metoxy-1,4-benzoquinol methylase